MPFLKYFIFKLYFSDDPETLDLSSHGLTKLSRAAPGYELTTMTLLLDNNSLQRLDNIHTYQCLEKVSKHLKTIFYVNKNDFTEKKHFSEIPKKTYRKSKKLNLILKTISRKKSYIHIKFSFLYKKRSSSCHPKIQQCDAKNTKMESVLSKVFQGSE